MSKINETKNYKLFVLHEFNRIVDESKPKFKDLLRLLAANGWVDAYPMYVVQNGDGRLKIKDGHNRFVAAKKLGLPVKYVIAPDVLSMADINRGTNWWKLNDYMTGNVQRGKKDYQLVKDYHEKTGIGLMNCIAILGGQTAGTTSKNEAFKEGRFTLGNLSNAQAIADIVACLQHNGVDYATNSNFVKAISMVVWVNGFSVNELKKKISRHRALITRQPTRDTYLKMLEEVYNRQRKDKIPLEFMAKEAAKTRGQVVLGPKKTARRGNLAAVRK